MHQPQRAALGALTWASSHSFRRTLTTYLHGAGVPDRKIAGQGGWKRVQVMQDHYFAAVPESTVAADLRAAQRVSTTGTRRQNVQWE